MTKNFDDFFNSIVERALHSSPYYISDKFDLKYIGTGEGNSTYGWGLYFAEHEEVIGNYNHYFRYGKGYDKVYNYEVEINAKEEELLDYDLEFEKQSKFIQNLLKPIVDVIRTYKWKEYGNGGGRVVDEEDFPADYRIPVNTEKDLEDFQTAKGQYIYEFIKLDGYSSKEVSRLLWSIGVKGMRYKNGFSRKDGEENLKQYNYVIFDDSIVHITNRKIVENTEASVFGNTGPYDTSDARTPFIMGTFNRRGKVKKGKKKRKNPRK